jgi:hypothetical protein
MSKDKIVYPTFDNWWSSRVGATTPRDHFWQMVETLVSYGEDSDESYGRIMVKETVNDYLKTAWEQGYQAALHTKQENKYGKFVRKLWNAATSPFIRFRHQQG